MNHKLVFNYLAKLIIALGLLLLLPIVTAICYKEWKCLAIFSAVSVFSIVLGFIIKQITKPKSNLLFAKEGFAITALAWTVMSLLGALPFTLSGEIPSYIDAFFETVSGFTTTGASIITDLSVISKSMLMWRSFTHWVGGMGVLVFMMAVLPGIPDRGVHIMRAEMPGPIFGKIVPRSKDTAKILYIIYIVLTIAMVPLLLFGGMPLFDSIVHALGTAGTGGFGIRGDSVASYSPYIQWVITIFMLIFAVNFNLYYCFLIKRSLSAFKSTELYVFLVLVGASVCAICINILNIFGNFSDALRHSAFQVASILSTTGFASCDYNQWPDFSKAIIFILTFIGGCAGSTAGGLKLARVVLGFKIIKSEFSRLIHPRGVTVVKFEGKPIDSTTKESVTVYFSVYIACIAAVLLLLSLQPLGLVTNLTAAVTCINNVGPGFDLVGPAGSFSVYNDFSTLVLSFTMLLGRLEFFPMLLTCMPGTWKRN